MSSSGAEFRVPNVPSLGHLNIKLETIGEDEPSGSRTGPSTQAQARLDAQAGLYNGSKGDALAVNKDGYVHTELLNVQSNQIAHLSYFCPGKGSALNICCQGSNYEFVKGYL